MIIFRYLCKELLQTTAVIVTLLMVVFLSNQFVRLLNKIAAGKMAVAILFKIIVLEIPFLLGYLLPVGVFFAILLSIGRLYADSEITVLQACGFSEKQLLNRILLIALPIAVLVAVLVFWIAPLMLRYQAQAMTMEASDLLLQTLMPGRFQAIDEGKQVFYIENSSHDNRSMRNIFMAQWQKLPNNANKINQQWIITTAQYAVQGVDPKTGASEIIAYDGYRYSGEPGAKDYDVAHFDKASLILVDKDVSHNLMIKALPTSKIWRAKGKDPSAEAEWQWRLSMPFSVILLVILGVPLARVKPRQGKFAKILPAALLYIVYANMLFVGRGWVEAEKIPATLGLWVIHLPAILLAIILLIDETTWLRIKRKFML